MEVGLYASRRLREHTRWWDLRLEKHWFETVACRLCLGQSRISDISAADVSRPDMRLRGCDCLRDTLDVQVEELFLVPDVLKEYQIFSV